MNGTGPAEMLEDVVNKFRRITQAAETIEADIPGAFRDYELNAFSQVFGEIKAKLDECFNEVLTASQDMVFVINDDLAGL